MKKNYLILVIMFILWFSILVFGHGLTVKIEHKYPCVLVTSKYHGGTVLRGAEVKIFFVDPGAASAAKKEFQKGCADRNGKFVFVPDREGVYRFYADDGMGHRKKTDIKISAEFFNAGSVKKNKLASGDAAHPAHKPLRGREGNKLASGGQNPFEKGFRTPKTSDKALRAKTRKEANPANASAGFFYCKVSLGVVLILALTFIFYTWKKKKERGAGNL